MSGKSNIGYGFSESNAGDFHTFNCLKNEQNPEKYYSASKEDVEKAAELAQAAFLVYGRSDGQLRARFLKRIAEEMDEHREELISWFVKEASLSRERGAIELNRTIFQLETFSTMAHSERWVERIEFEDSAKGMRIHRMNRGIGPVVVFGASNFPFAYSTVGGDTAAALAAGCSVIVKAHPMHAGTSEAVAQLVLKVAKELELPNGVFSHVFDGGHEVGAALVQHPLVKAVGFTGSIRGGRALMDLSAKRDQPIPVFAEMGSLNPVVLFDEGLSADRAHWVDAYKHSISNDAGQFCTKPGLLFVPDTKEGNRFITELRKALEETEPQCHLHPNLFASYQKQVTNSFDWKETGQPYHSQPTLREVSFSDFNTKEQLREEFFGPQSIVVQYSGKQELWELLNHLQGQLTATIIASDEEVREHWDVVTHLGDLAGRLIRNGVPTGVTVCDAMVHGGTYPAASDSRFTAVGSQSMYRFLRPVSFQNF